MTYRVLIADDEERMRRVLAMVFDEMKDTKVVTARDCLKTLENLKKEGFIFLIKNLKELKLGGWVFLDFL